MNRQDAKNAKNANRQYGFGFQVSSFKSLSGILNAEDAEEAQVVGGRW